MPHVRRVGIFAGSDERHTAFVKAQRKKKVNTTNRTKASVVAPSDRTPHALASSCYYGFKGLRLDTLLGLTIAQPHQYCLREGILVNWNPSYRGRTLFVSHEWTSWTHADHEGHQLRVLQQVLRRLMRGEVAEVATDAGSGMLGMGHRFYVTGSEWKAALAAGDAFVFYDYWSIPQPTCAIPMPAAESENELLELEQEQLATADHRVGTSHVVDCLNRAVQSLPSYIERSDLVLVLCPMVKHRDRGDDYICDFASWRSRGWCRLEAVSAALAKAQPKVMLVKGPSDSDVQFLNLRNALESPVGDGCFTCCQRGHDFGTGFVKCDKLSVCEVYSRRISQIVPVLDKLLDAKLAMLWEEKQSLLDYRCFATNRALVLKGLPAAARSGGLAALKKRLRWGEGVDEAAITKRTGMSLLMWAVMAGGVDAVRELLREDGEGVSAVNVKIKINREDLGLIKGYSPVLMAMHALTTGFDVVDLLLDAGADPHSLYKNVIGTQSPLCVAATGGHNPPEKITRWMQRYPEYDPDFGSNPPLVMATGCGQSTAFLRALVNAGCDPAFANPIFGATPLIGAVVDLSGMPAVDAEALAYLLSLPSVQKNALDTRQKPRSRTFQFIYWVSRMKVRLGMRGGKVDIEALSEGNTALHVAAMFGNDQGVRQLLAAGADPTIKNTIGMTAAEAAQWYHRGSLPPLLAEALGGAGGDDCTPLAGNGI